MYTIIIITGFEFKTLSLFTSYVSNVSDTTTTPETPYTPLLMRLARSPNTIGFFSVPFISVTEFNSKSFHRACFPTKEYHLQIIRYAKHITTFYVTVTLSRATNTKLKPRIQLTSPEAMITTAQLHVFPLFFTLIKIHF